MGPIGYPEMVVIGLIGLILLSIPFWIWMLVDCILKEPAEEQTKVKWVVVICVLGGLGALIYLFARRPTRKRLYGH